MHLKAIERKDDIHAAYPVSNQCIIQYHGYRNFTLYKDGNKATKITANECDETGNTLPHDFFLLYFGIFHDFDLAYI